MTLHINNTRPVDPEPIIITHDPDGHLSPLKGS